MAVAATAVAAMNRTEALMTMARHLTISLVGGLMTVVGLLAMVESISVTLVRMRDLDNLTEALDTFLTVGGVAVVDVVATQ